VPHKRLLRKLKCYGMNRHVLEWIESFFCLQKKQRVAVIEALSSWTGVLSGVLQGSVLGPILFVCYINDMLETIASFVYMYADDTKIGRAVTCGSDGLALRSDLDQLGDWSQKWQLRFNVSKYKVMHYGRNNVNEQYTMQDDSGSRYILQESKEEKDLGVCVDNMLKFLDHVAQAACKANRLLGLIRRSFTHLDITLMKQLYTVMVRPHLEYGNVVWHPQLKQNIELLEAVQHRVTKMIPGLSHLSYEERLKRMGLPSLSYRRLYVVMP